MLQINSSGIAAAAFTRPQSVQYTVEGSIVVQLGDNYIPELAMHLETARVVETVYIAAVHQQIKLMCPWSYLGSQSI